MSLDCFAIPVTSSSTECIQAINAYYDAVLAYKPFTEWAIADAAVEADGGCPLAKVLAADYAHCSGKGARAQELLDELQQTLDGAGTGEGLSTERERLYLRAWRQWVCDMNPAGCFATLLEVVQKHPTDLFAVKRGHIMGLILGSGSKILEIVEAAASRMQAIDSVKYLHGMWAFGLEQEGRYEDAEAKAKEGLDLEAKLGPDAWLDHGFAHALYFQGEDRLEDAVEFLESRSATWSADKLHPFLYTHNWWHLALLYCEQREFPKALSIFDSHLWAHEEMRGDPQVQINALGLLWRFETRGAGELASERWSKVVDACRGVTLPAAGATQPAPLQHSDFLLDILLVRAFAAAPRGGPSQLDEWLAAISSHADVLAAKADADKQRADAYASIAKATAALFRSDQPEAGVAAREAAARRELRELKPLWSCIGGSEEQRGILLEAVEGPVVCGGPERNFDKLFF